MLYKDPSEELDYTVDWSAWLREGDTIVRAEFAVPPGLSEPRPPTVAPTQATVWLAGGDAGGRYVVTNTVTTAAGRVGERSLVLTVRER